MENNKKKTLAIVLSIFGVVAVIGSTYAFITQTLNTTKKHVLTAGTLELRLEEDNNNLMISDAYPMYDEVGMIQDAFTFSLVNNSINSVNYDLSILKVNGENELSPTDVKYYLTKNGIGIGPEYLSTLGDVGPGVALKQQALKILNMQGAEEGLPEFKSIEEYLDFINADATAEEKITLYQLLMSIVIGFDDGGISLGFPEDLGWCFCSQVGYYDEESCVNKLSSIYGSSYKDIGNYMYQLNLGFIPDTSSLESSAISWCQIVMGTTTEEECIVAINEGLGAETTSIEEAAEYMYQFGLIPKEAVGGAGGIIDTGTINGRSTINYEFRMWISDEVTDNDRIAGKSLSYKLDIKVSQEINCPALVYNEPNEPVLTSGMIAVIYNETEKTWVKADTTNNNWYDYDNQVWANAVTVTKETRESYMSAKAGTPVLMNDINTMWVWIPRYSYTIRDTYGVQLEGGLTPSEATPGAIDIKFISKDQKDTGTGQCKTCPDNWVTPEGFTFGTEEIPGFWMGKFETSTLESCTPTGDINTGCDLTTLTPQIKPNVTSWRGARVSTFFLASRLMQSSDNSLNYNATTYGFDAEGASTMDTHMLKNTEWGIVAMLSQSKYGKYGNTNYTGVNKEVYQNKSSSYITGSSNGTPSQEKSNTQVTYDTPDTGYGASTTGTIYGIYDMSGGTEECVMGNLNNDSGYDTSTNSGFCGTDGPTENCREWPNAKYYDLYTSSAASTGYKFGDGTYETSGWYKDHASFVISINPWFLRGGGYSDNTTAGVFISSVSNGRSDTYDASRFVIKP